MPEKKIFLLYSDLLGNEKKLPKELPEKSGCWLYFGKDYRNLKRVESHLGSNFELIEISRELDEISGFLRDDFQNYMDKTNRLNKDSFEWWFTPLSSRNIYISEVFQNICYLQLLKDKYEKHPENIVLIVVESYSAGRIIEEWAKDNKIAIKSVSRPDYRKFRIFFEAFCAIGKTTAKTIIYYIFAVISSIKAGRKIPYVIPENGKKTALIDLFVYESNFGENGSFNDRYFPGLEAHLKSNDYNVIYYPTLTETKLNKYALYQKMRENERFFVISEDYLHISDYIRSLIISLKAVTFSGEIPDFKDYDISFFDKLENKWSCLNGIFKSILVYRLFIRLGDIIGDDVERIISWHENQLKDKALSLAVHKCFSGTKIIGVEHFIHYSNYLSIYSIDSEVENKIVPDVILTTGIIESKKLKKYLSLVPVAESAALRYSHLFNPYGKKVAFSRDILILLPYDRNDAFEILMRVVETIDDLNGFSNIVVKCHPDYEKELFSDIFENKGWSDKIIFSDKKIDELLQSVAVVISGASGSLLEAAVSGVPTILISKSNALNLNPFESLIYSCISVCYDQNSLKESLNKYLSYSVEEREESVIIGKKLRDQFFTQKNEKTMKVFEKNNML